jgi:transcriptional regulator with PAS, ATPase and Fis domain
VEENRFREDLFYRLDIFQICLPPLRERGGDIVLLVNHFLKQFSDDYQRSIVGISPESISALETYQWPGNVREIKNVIHRAVLNCTGDILLPEHLPERLQKTPAKCPRSACVWAAHSRRRSVKSYCAPCTGLRTTVSVRLPFLA